MVIAVIVVLAFVVYVAMGRGGELSDERSDYVPLDLGPVSATDVVLLRPPTGLWGYNMRATDEAMEQVAESIRERDVRIVALEQLVTDLSRDHAPMPLLASPYEGARHRRAPVDTAETEAARAPVDVQASREAQAAEPARLLPDPPRLAFGPPRVPFDPPRPAGDVTRPAGDVTGPPERSHD
jgi:hypothetical protein